MVTETRYEHVVLNEAGVPVIAGANMKVVELVLSHLAYGWGPEELERQHPHLTMGQIHSALAYYWDHKAEIDEDIQRRKRLVDEWKKSTPPCALQERLKASKLL